MRNSANNTRHQARHREKLRRQGMRPLQVWVPDPGAPGFADEYRRQAKLVAETYASGGEDADLLDFIERTFDADFPE